MTIAPRCFWIGFLLLLSCSSNEVKRDSHDFKPNDSTSCHFSPNKEECYKLQRAREYALKPSAPPSLCKREGLSEEIFEDPGVYHDCLAMDGGTLSEKGVRLLFAGYVMLTPLSEPITKKMTFGFLNLTGEEYYEQAFIVIDEDFKPTRLKNNYDEEAVFIERNRGTYKIHSDGLIAISSPIDSSCTANLKSTSGMRLRLNTFSNPGKNVIAAFTSNDVASPPYGRVLNKLSFIPIADLMKKPIKLSPPYVDESSLVIGDKKYSAFYGCLGDQK